jgi:Na+/H+ antiporter NhaD/arsenite permease-like protein
MDNEDLKDISVQILIVGTAVNVFTFIYYYLSGFNDFILGVLAPVIMTQLALFIVTFGLFSHAMNQEEAEREEQRIRELENKIKTLEKEVFTEE